VKAGRKEKWNIRSVTNSVLIQNMPDFNLRNLKVVTKRKPTKNELKSMIYAFKVVKHCKSNALVFVKNERTVGIGLGQTSRVDCAWIAGKKAGKKLKGSVMASDAFFPFRDSVDVAAKYGVKAVIQPGGSIKDKEVIDACNEYNIAMVFTGVRVFRH